VPRPQYKQLRLEPGALSGFLYIYAFLAIYYSFPYLLCHCFALLADDPHRAD